MKRSIPWPFSVHVSSSIIVELPNCFSWGVRVSRRFQSTSNWWRSIRNNKTTSQRCSRVFHISLLSPWNRCRVYRRINRLAPRCLCDAMANWNRSFSIKCSFNHPVRRPMLRMRISSSNPLLVSRFSIIPPQQDRRSLVRFCKFHACRVYSSQRSIGFYSLFINICT